MKTFIKKIIIPAICLAILIGIFGANVSFASDASYQLLTPLPVPSGSNPDTSCIYTQNPVDYFNLMFRIIISLAVVFSVFMIVYGGIQTMASGDSVEGVRAGKDKVKQAVYGLLLLAGCYLILWTINPNLLNLGEFFKLPTDTPNCSQPAPQPTTTTGATTPTTPPVPYVGKISYADPRTPAYHGYTDIVTGATADECNTKMDSRKSDLASQGWVSISTYQACTQQSL